MTDPSIEASRAVIAALDHLPPVPEDTEAKKRWLLEVRPALDAADQALGRLRRQSFFHHDPPPAEASAASAKVAHLAQVVFHVEDEVGTRKPPAAGQRSYFDMFTRPWAVTIDVVEAINHEAYENLVEAHLEGE